MSKPVEQLDRVVIRFAGDSGDGMQLTGDRFTSETAAFGNDLSTLPNFPAEIRAPAGTLPGVSSFQVHFADHDIQLLLTRLADSEARLVVLRDQLASFDRAVGTRAERLDPEVAPDVHPYTPVGFVARKILQRADVERSICCRCHRFASPLFSDYSRASAKRPSMSSGALTIAIPLPSGVRGHSSSGRSR